MDNTEVEATRGPALAKEDPHPYERDDALNDRLYNVSRKVDRILNRESVENHAAILGFIQVSGQRRAHEYELDKQKTANAQRDAAMEAAREAQRQARFGPG